MTRALSDVIYNSAVMTEVVNSYATIENSPVFSITIDIYPYDMQEKQSYTGFR